MVTASLERSRELDLLRRFDPETKVLALGAVQPAATLNERDGVR